MQGQGQGLSPAAPSPASDPPGAERRPWRVGLVHDRLLRAYGQPPDRPATAPLDELIATILSQHTSDANSGRAYASLRRAFPTWEALLTADDASIAAAIRVGGLGSIKASRIRNCLIAVARRAGTLSLDFLADLDTETARAALEAIPGVGAKTAACVLLFSLGRPVVPVDTHVHRVSLRLGLSRPGASPEEVERDLEAQLPPADCYSAHVGLIAHGRQVCRARRPLCEECVLADLCDARAAEQTPTEAPAAAAGAGPDGAASDPAGSDGEVRTT